MGKILVTGGAGFIGSHLAGLLSTDNEVHVWDNYFTGNPTNIESYHVFPRYLDISTLDTFKDEGFDTIYHLAALPRIQPSFRDPKFIHMINVGGTQRILDVARANKAKVVYVSSSSVYHETNSNPYTFTKWLGEEYCKLYTKVYHVPTVIARLFNVYGPRQIRKGEYATVMGVFEQQTISKQPLTVTGNGEQRRDFTHVHDVINGLKALGQKAWNGEVFNFGSGINHSINEVAQMFNPKGVEYLPTRKGEALQTLADISLSQKELGYTPQHTIEDYISRFLEEIAAIP